MGYPLSDLNPDWQVISRINCDVASKSRGETAKDILYSPKVFLHDALKIV
jgi:hypothetical protein